MVLSSFVETTNDTFQVVSKDMGRNKVTPDQIPWGQDWNIHYPPYLRKAKEELLLGPSGPCDEDLRPHIWKQNTPLLQQEISELFDMWPAPKAAYKAAVEMPVLCGLGEFD